MTTLYMYIYMYMYIVPYSLVSMTTSCTSEIIVMLFNQFTELTLQIIVFLTKPQLCLYKLC